MKNILFLLISTFFFYETTGQSPCPEIDQLKLELNMKDRPFSTTDALKGFEFKFLSCELSKNTNDVVIEFSFKNTNNKDIECSAWISAIDMEGNVYDRDDSFQINDKFSSGEVKKAKVTLTQIKPNTRYLKLVVLTVLVDLKTYKLQYKDVYINDPSKKKYQTIGPNSETAILSVENSAKLVNDTKNNASTSNSSSEYILKGNVKGLAKSKKGVVIVEDIEAGEKVGESTIDSGYSQYEIPVPYGKKYSLNIVADGYLGTSQLLDLTDKNTIKPPKDLELTPIVTGSNITLNNVFFSTGKSILLPESFLELNKIGTILLKNPNLKIEVGGHTDDVGGEQDNLILSQDRADAVKYYLQSKGVKANQIITKGYGKSKPKANGVSEFARAENRRVELTIIK